MFLNKIFHFVKGYVIINISGFYIERFLYICAKQGIELFEIGKRTDTGVVLCISISDFRNLKPVVRKTGVKIRTLKKCGLPFLIKKAQKRYVLFSAIAVFSLISLVSSNFIWSVEICGDSKKASQEVGLAAELAGIKIGAYKPFLPEGEQIKSIILNNTDNVVWAWVYIKGTKAVVKYKEGISPPAVIDKSLPCDIVAVRGGVIEEIIEKNGNSRVAVGDTVAKDDLLIAGTEDMPDGSYRTVHAIGNVRARVWHEKSGDYKLYKDISVPTGNRKKFRTVKFFSKCFDLFFTENVGYTDYKITEKLSELSAGRGNYLGIGIYEKTYHETKQKRIPITYEQAVEIGKNDLEMQISKELLPCSVLADKKIIHTRLDDETVRVSVTMEFFEQIGGEIPII